MPGVLQEGPAQHVPAVTTETITVAIPGRGLAIHGRTHLYLLGYCRTGLLVLVLGSWYYFYMSYTIQRSEPSSPRWPQPAAAMINKNRPGRGRPGPKQAGRTRPNSRPAAARGRLRLTAPDIMHWYKHKHSTWSTIITKVPGRVEKSAFALYLFIMINDCVLLRIIVDSELG